MTDPVEVATTAIANVLKLLSNEDRRVVVQGVYNVEMNQFGGDQLLRLAHPLGVLEAMERRRATKGVA